MKKFLTLSFILTGLFILNPLQTQACSGKHHQNYSKDETKADKLKKDVKTIWMHDDVLKISDEQKTKIKDIKHTALKKLIQQQADIDIIVVDYKTAMAETKLDVGKVNKLLDKKYDAKKKIAKTHVKALSDIQNILTDTQRKALNDAKTKMHYSKDGDCPKSKCLDCKDGKKCAKCAAKSDGICPITGKPLNNVKGSMKGSDKGSMKE